MNATDENMTPAKDDGFEKRLKLKRIKKKKTKFDLNTSTSKFKSFQSRMNISAANSSVVKASLRANNKALAQSLEKVRQDLRVSYEVNNELKKENQDLQLRLMNLERVAGLKDESLENEVQRRIEDKIKQLKLILSSVSVHLLDAGSCLQDALDKCIDPTRLSVASSARHSSLGTSDDACSPLNSGATSSIYYNPNTFSRVSSQDPKPVRTSEPLPVDAEDTPEGMLSRQQLQEMTMILEQSVLAEVEDLPEVAEDINGHEAESNEETIATVVKVSPQVTKKISVTSKSTNGSQKEGSKATSLPRSPKPPSSKISTEKQDRRGTFVVPTTVQYETKPTEEKILQDRRATFVLRKPDQEEITSKRAAKRETFVLKAPAVIDPLKESKEEKSVFKAPLPVSILSKDVPMDQDEDMTVYPNTDMELTEVIHLDQLADSVSKQKHENQGMDDRKKDKNTAKSEQIKEKPKTKIAKSSSLTAISTTDKKDLKMSKSDTDINKDKNESTKSAVVLQLRKPGKIVFSAARKEYDGSRKAIPSKLPLRPRSKSKKVMRELKDSIAAESSEPKNIFDFHDKTPIHLSEKSRIQPSVYDLSMNESNQQPTTEPVALKDEQTKNKGKKGSDVKGEDVQKCDSVSITYTMPLKESPDEKKPKHGERSRSRSRTRSKTRKQDSDTEGETDKEVADDDGKTRGRQERSKSRTRRKDIADEDNKKETQRKSSSSNSTGYPTRARSQSRKRLANDMDEDESEAEKDIVIDRKSRSRSRKKLPSSADDGEAESVDESGQCVTEIDLENKIGEPEKNSVKNSGKKDLDDGDDDLKVSGAQQKVVRSGRSKRRKHLDSEDEIECQQVEPSKDNVPECAESAPNEGRPGRAAKTKAFTLNKNMAEHNDSDSVLVPVEAINGERQDQEELIPEDNIVLLDDSFKSNDLQPISSRDFISRISSSQQNVKSSDDDDDNENIEESNTVKKSSRSKGRKGPLPSETDDDDEVEVVKRKSTRTKDKKKTKKLASATDDEVEHEDHGNKTKVVLASDDEGHSGEVPSEGETFTTKKSDAISQGASDTVETKEVTKGSNRKEDKVDSKKDAMHTDQVQRKDASSGKQGDVYSLALKTSPEPSRGRSKTLKKVERCRSHSRKRVDVNDILQAFKEADDPDHSLRLNAVGKNDSVVIAEVIRNACIAGDREQEKVEKLCDLEALAESAKGEVYSLPLKDSPKESAKLKGRSRSQSRSRGRSRSKKRVIDSDDDCDDDKDDDFVVSKPRKATKRPKSVDLAGASTAEESKTYTLPLKGSPDGPKNVTSRSRSKSRPRSSARGRSQSRKRTEPKDESPDRIKAKEPTQKDNDGGRSRSKKRAEPVDHSPDKVDSKECGAKEDLNVTFDAESPAGRPSRSVKKLKNKTMKEKVTETEQVSTEKVKSRRKVIEDDESPEKVECLPVENLNVTFDAESPSDSEKRIVKVVETKPCEEEKEDKKTESHPSGKSTGKKSAKKKGDNSARKSQQAELKEKFNELKRKLSMMPRASDRMSLVTSEKENEETLKRKRESNEDKSELGMEKRSRRAATSGISYKEVSVGAKLRRGDPGTSHFFSTDPLKIFKSPVRTSKETKPKSNSTADGPKRKYKTSDSDGNNDRQSHDVLQQGVLDNISNTVPAND